MTLVGAVSPSGADFTEPVTTHTIRFIRTFWALDTRLAYSRHYPAINWMTSYSGYINEISKWWSSRVDKNWAKVRADAYEILQREDALKEIVRLLGPEALPDEEKLVLEAARMIKIGYLQQSAYDEVDSYCSPKKQYLLLKLFVEFYQEALKALRAGVGLDTIRAMSIIPKLLRAKFEIRTEEVEKLETLREEMLNEFQKISAVEVKTVV
jgi:V/A-type H+-transporting ATPase subunit A